MDGYRTDHMGVSPDRRRLLVSDSTGGPGHRVQHGRRDAPRRHRDPDGRTAAGPSPPARPRTRTTTSPRAARSCTPRSAGSTRPGDYPVIGPIDASFVHDSVKADRWLQIVRNKDFDILKRWDMGKELAEAGHPGMSSAVRPVALTPDAQDPLRPGLVLPRPRRVRPRREGPDRRRGLRARRGARAGARRGHPADRPAGRRQRAEHAARAVRPRLGPPRAGDQRRGHEALRRRARCRTTPRSSTGGPSRPHDPQRRRPVPATDGSTPSPTGPPRGRATPAGCR